MTPKLSAARRRDFVEAAIRGLRSALQEMDGADRDGNREPLH
jgi:hypothetical protein